MRTNQNLSDLWSEIGPVGSSVISGVILVLLLSVNLYNQGLDLPLSISLGILIGGGAAILRFIVQTYIITSSIVNDIIVAAGVSVSSYRDGTGLLLSIGLGILVGIGIVILRFISQAYPEAIGR